MSTVPRSAARKKVFEIRTKNRVIRRMSIRGEQIRGRLYDFFAEEDKAADKKCAQRLSPWTGVGKTPEHEREPVVGQQHADDESQDRDDVRRSRSVARDAVINRAVSPAIL